jgi:hypothetical protein
VYDAGTAHCAICITQSPPPPGSQFQHENTGGQHCW